MTDLNARMDSAEETLKQEGAPLDVSIRIIYDHDELPDSKMIFGEWSERGPDGKRFRIVRPKEIPVQETSIFRDTAGSPVT